MVTASIYLELDITTTPFVNPQSNHDRVRATADPPVVSQFARGTNVP